MSINFAHRGASGYYPENTMLAFEKAIEMGCDGIETDVHITKDGQMVICHDEKIDRTTDGTGMIQDYTYSELCKFDAGARFEDGKYKGMKMPLLDEFFDLVKDKKLIINLELKTNVIDYPNLEQKVIDSVYKYGIQDRIIISSFNHCTVMNCKKIDSNLKYGFLYSNPLYRPGDYGKHAGVDAMHPSVRCINEEIVKNIHDQGLEINVYTANTEEDMKYLIDFKIDGIITNYPDVLRKLLKA